MNAPAWIFLAAFLLQALLFTLVVIDRGVWQQRAATRHKTICDLMARHAALIITLRAAGYPVPVLDVVDVTDLDKAKSTADIPWMPQQRRGGDAS